MTTGFHFNHVLSSKEDTRSPNAPLGPLAALAGKTFTNAKGTFGFNQIFRPDSEQTPTTFPVMPPGTPNNVLELNITSETLRFGQQLGSIPNRGEVQKDAFLNGFTYLQMIDDVTDPKNPVGIHAESGFWVHVPATQDPPQQESVFRQGSIPHGTQICAQGVSRTFGGPPVIPPVNVGFATPPSGITPFRVNTGPGTHGVPAELHPQASQVASATNTPRIPQVLPASITQAVLDDPNTLLRNAIAGLDVISTTEIQIATEADFSLGILASLSPAFFAGGVTNIDFLVGSADAAANSNTDTTEENALADSMLATFWILTVPVSGKSGHTTTYLAYSQWVRLEFGRADSVPDEGLYWPHVSVNLMVQQDRRQ